MLGVKKLVVKTFRVLDPDVNTKDSRLLVFSKFAFKIHKFLGTNTEMMEIFYPGLKQLKIEKIANEKNINILFVGTWFERKGGNLLLKAFNTLSGKYLDIRLTIVGEVSEKFKIQNPNLKVYDYLPREKLIREFFPKADIFVLIPPKVEGFGFSVVEAMSFGLVPVVSNVCALPELIEDGVSGLVVKAGDLKDLVAKLDRLIANQSLRKTMSKHARDRFEKKFSARKSNDQLLKIYKKTLSE